MSVSNYKRLLRSFIEDNDEALRIVGVDVDHDSTHVDRRTAATLVDRRTAATFVERAAGRTTASRLLGHANDMVTRSSYIVIAEQVDTVTADILDRVLGG